MRMFFAKCSLIKFVKMLKKEKKIDNRWTENRKYSTLEIKDIKIQ